MKSSLIALLAFFISLWLLYKKSGVGHPVATWRGLSPGERGNVIITAAVYGLICLAGLRPDGPLQVLRFLKGPADAFLTVEPLLGITMLLLAAGALCIRGSQKEYLNTLNTVARILAVVSVTATLLVRQIHPLCWYNAMWLLVVGILLIGCKILSLERLPEAGAAGSLFDPAGGYNDLFPPRKRQADELYRIICSEASSGLSICVTGPWGSGKTSLVQGTCDKLRQETNYKFIFLRALELDNLSSLFRYLFARIREILKARGAYVGLGSEYRRLIASAGGMISSAPLSAVLEQQLFPAEEDYRSQRERLESLMTKVLQGDKVVIVVDDIERCEPEKAREFLYFIKEIATMRCCVSIFVTDDTSLPLPDHLAEDGKANFFDKFFNYRIVLSHIQTLDMMMYYEQEKNLPAELNEFQLDLPRAVYQKLQKRLQERVESVQMEFEMLRGGNSNQEAYEKETKDHQAYLRICAKWLEETLSRPRTLIKFYEKYRENCACLQSCYESQPKDQLKKYFESLKLSELLFLQAYLEVCFPAEWEEIQMSGFRTYLEQVQASQNEPKQFLSELMQDTLFRDYLLSPSYSYQNEKQIRFLDTLLLNPEELLNIINSFTTQEQEWFDAIEKGDERTIEANWSAILRTVVEQYPKLKKGCTYLECLIQFAKEQVTSGCWNIDMPLRIFEHIELDEQSLFNEDCIVPLVSLFDQEISEVSLLKGVSGQTKSKLQAIMPFYLHTYFIPICRALQYAAPLEQNIIHEALKGILTDHQNQITGFLMKVRKCEIWRRQLLEDLEEIDGLDILLNDAERVLRENGSWSYPDVQDTFGLANDAMREVRALLHLLNQVRLVSKQGSNESLPAAIRNDDLSEALSYIVHALQQPKTYEPEQMRRDFYELFQYVETCMPGKISKEDLHRLNELVIRYYQLRPYGYRESTFFFRCRLLALENRSRSGPTPT